MNETSIFYIVGAFFIFSGALQVLWGKAFEKYSLQQGAVYSSRTVKLGALVLVVGGIGLMVEDVREYSIYGLCAFLIFAGFSIHQFWAAKGLELQVSELLQLLKNIGLAILLFGLTLLL